MYKPHKTANAATGGKENVRGRQTANAMTPVKPGIAPKIIPTILPINMSNNTRGEEIAENPLINISTILETPYTKRPFGRLMLNPNWNVTYTTTEAITAIKLEVKIVFFVNALLNNKI